MAVHTYTRAKDGATVYCAVFFGPDGRRKVRKVKTVPKDAAKKDHERAHAAAEHNAHVQRAQVENQEWRDPKQEGPARLTFSQLVNKFLKTYRSRSGRVDYYEQRSRIWVKHFGALTVRGLTVADVDRFRVEREKAGVSLSTVRKDLCNLSTLFRWAKARGLMLDNPADPDRVKRPPAARPRPNPLSREEEVTLLSHARDALKPVLELILETGADRSEIVGPKGLNWNLHVDRDRKLLILPRAKTGIARTLPYGQNARIRRVLAEAGKVRDTSGTVFLDLEGDPIRLQAAKTAMRDAWGFTFPCRCEGRDGLEGRQKPHTERASCPTRAKSRPWKSLRATFATRKAEAGVDVPSIAALMGLTTSHVLEHYVKPSGVHLEAAMADSGATRSQSTA